MVGVALPKNRGAVEVFIGGFKWRVIPGRHVAKDEIGMLVQDLPMMEKRMYRVAKWLNQFNSEGSADFEASVTLETLRFVRERMKGTKEMVAHSHGFTGKYPDLRIWQVQVSKGAGRKPFHLTLLKQSEELGDATYWYPVAYTPVDKEDLRE